MPDQDHGHSHDSGKIELALTLVTCLGLGVALLDRFALTLPQGVVPAALAMSFAAGGIPAAISALRELFGRGRLDIDLLMVIAALAAAAVGAALEGAVLLALFSTAGMLEHRAMGRARAAVDALMALRPETALRLRGDGGFDEVAVAEVAVGDHLLLRPGARRCPRRACRWSDI